MEQPSDRPLNTGLVAGDPRAFEALYERYAQRLYHVALVITGRPADAEDAVQEIFMSLVRSRKQLATVENLAAYLFTALRHTAAKLSKQRRQRAIGNLENVDPAAPQMTPSTERNEQLNHAIGQLPVEQREVIALKIDGGLTFAQIAEVTGTRPNTAASRYRYALEKLRSILEQSS